MKYPSGSQSGRSGGRGELQGGQGSLRGADRLAQARRLRPVRSRRPRGGARGGGRGGFSADAFSDIFGDVFGDIFGGAPPRRPQPGVSRRRPALRARARSGPGGVRPPGRDRGADARPSARPATAAAPPRAPAPCTCDTCGGAGQVRVSQGFFPLQQTCPRCRGTGTHRRAIPATPASARGACGARSKLSVKVPAGRRHRRSHPARRARARPGRNGGPPGDLYVEIAVREHAIFERDGRAPELRGADELRHRGARRQRRGADARGRRDAEDSGGDPVRPRLSAARQGREAGARRRARATCSAASWSRRRCTCRPSSASCCRSSRSRSRRDAAKHAPREKGFLEGVKRFFRLDEGTSAPDERPRRCARMPCSSAPAAAWAARSSPPLPEFPRLALQRGDRLARQRCAGPGRRRARRRRTQRRRRHAPTSPRRCRARRGRHRLHAPRRRRRASRGRASRPASRCCSAPPASRRRCERRLRRAPRATSPLLVAPNTSLGVTLLLELARQRGGRAAAGFDARDHRDPPPPTSAMRPRAPRSRSAAALRAGARAESRRALTGPRGDAIGFRAARAATSSASTRCCFAGAGEALVLTHRATDRAIFARGALRGCALACVAAPGPLRHARSAARKTVT